MSYDKRHWQYRQLATIYHGTDFGHYMELERQWRGRDATVRTGLGQWRSLGCPPDVLQASSGLLVAAWEEHILTRYGEQDVLLTKWAGEPEPF